MNILQAHVYLATYSPAPTIPGFSWTQLPYFQFQLAYVLRRVAHLSILVMVFRDVCIHWETVFKNISQYFLFILYFFH